MNYLAHLFLSCADDNLLIGNFIADSISNKEVKTYSEAIQKGVLLHRRIDSFTDKHPQVRQGTRRLYPNHGKYAPVVIDVFFDHILSKNWKKYSDEPLSEFAIRMYQTLIDKQHVLPPNLQKNTPIMIANNWLMSYGTESGLQFALERIDSRTQFPSNFKNALQDLKVDYELYEEEFNAFFPEVIGMVDAFCGC